MKKNKINQWCFKIDQCHWSLIMNMTNDSSVFVIWWQVNCHLKKKIYTDPQHNMQKNNIKITCQSLAHWVKSPKQSFRDSGLNQFILVQVTWDEQSSAAWLHGFILHISTISHNIPVSTSYDIRQWPIHVLAFSHYECRIAGIFSSNTVCEFL